MHKENKETLYEKEGEARFLAPITITPFHHTALVYVKYISEE